LILLAFSLVVGIINPSFFSIGNLFGLLKSNVVTGIFALGVLLVLISGGIDISFPAVAVVSMYMTGQLFESIGYAGPVILAFLIAIVIGMLLGTINAAIISTFRLPTLIVTLGTLSAYQGFVLTFVDTRIINRLTEPMVNYSRLEIFRTTMATGQTTGLHVSFFVYIALAILTALILRYTTIGRGVYALGGDRQATERAGFSIRRIEFFIYTYVGFLAGIGGILHSAHVRNANPFDLVGSELNVIAATVLGGATIGGGRGTVIGTLLGVMLITVMNNSLILLGIPSYWQRFTTGLILLVAVAVPQIRTMQRARPREERA
ncbi:MAG: ABC transporter permease, partial [Spirochaetales bacterium]|nr:ABC transporter permease [Spirochaetales bacterium]